MSSTLNPPESVESPERYTCDTEVQNVTVAVVMKPTVPVDIVPAFNAVCTSEGAQVGGQLEFLEVLPMFVHPEIDVADDPPEHPALLKIVFVKVLPLHDICHEPDPPTIGKQTDVAAPTMLLSSRCIHSH